MKTATLTGAALDWAVAIAEGHKDATIHGGVVRTSMRGIFGPVVNYSTDWAQGGPIIEREGICVVTVTDEATAWDAYFDWGMNDDYKRGPTPLIAAMRCYVASKLGDDVDVPEGIAP